MEGQKIGPIGAENNFFDKERTLLKTSAKENFLRN